MYTVLSSADEQLLRSIINGLAFSLGVQCAILEPTGKVHVRSHLPKSVRILPYDITAKLRRSGLLDLGTQESWKSDLQDVMNEAAASGRAQTVHFETDRLKLLQFIAPIIMDGACVGYVISGKIPFGDHSALDALVDSTMSKAGSQEGVAKLIKSADVLPKTRENDLLLRVIEAAHAVSRAPTQLVGMTEGKQTFEQRFSPSFKALNRIIQSINKSPSEHRILNIIVREGFELVGADLGTIALYDKSRNELQIKATAPSDYDSKLPKKCFSPNEGIKGLAFRTGKPVLVKDLKKEEEYRTIFVEVFPKIRSELVVLLRRRGTKIGVINVESTKPNAFTKSHITLLETLGQHLVVALDKVELARSKERQLRAFSDATARLGPQFDLQDTLHAIVRSAIRAVGGAYGNIKLYNDSTRQLEFWEISDSNGKRVNKNCMKPFEFNVWVEERSQHDSLSAWTFRHKQRTLTLDAHNEILWRSPPWEVGSCIHVPLVSERKRCIGVLVVDGTTTEAFTKSDVKVLELLAREAVMAIENQWHNSVVNRISSFTEKALRIPFEQDPTGQRVAMLSELAIVVWEEMRPSACSMIVPYEQEKQRKLLWIPPKCEFGTKGRPRSGVRLPAGEGLCGEAMRTGRCVYSPDVLNDERFADKEIAIKSNIVSALSYPIRLGEKSFGSLNYYSSYRRQFSNFEKHILQAICGIAGFIVSATETEKLQRYAILDKMGTGVSLIGYPPNWEEVKQAFKKKDPNWNFRIKMPLLFLNKVHDAKFAPNARARMYQPCYHAFNSSKQKRPCWWCPTLRSMITGETTTYFAHSPVPPKYRIEHFKVTSSVLKEDVAAIESTIPVTRELEGRNFAVQVHKTQDMNRILDITAECLGRGTRSDSVIFTDINPSSGDIRFERIYGVDQNVLRAERKLPEWTPDIPFQLPPPEEYFNRREKENLYLFKELPKHTALRKRLSPDANQILNEVLSQEHPFYEIPDHRLLPFFHRTGLLTKADFPKRMSNRNVRPPRGIILRIGPKEEPMNCMILLDKRPRKPECEFEEPGHERHWCAEVLSELTTKLCSIKSQHEIERLSEVRKAIFEAAPIGLVRTGKYGEVLTANSAWQRIMRDDIVGRNLLNTDYIKKAGLTIEVKKALDGQAIRIEERRMQNAIGQELIVSLACIPLSTHDNGLLIICWDMTDVTQRYERLINRNELMVLGNLTAGATHEMKHAAITAHSSVRHIARTLARLIKTEHSLAKYIVDDARWEHFRDFVDNILKWIDPDAAPLGNPNDKEIKKIKRILSKHNLKCSDTDARILARFNLTDKLSYLLTLSDSNKLPFSYILNMTRIALYGNRTCHSISQLREISRAIEMQSFISPNKLKRVSIHDTIDAALLVLDMEIKSCAHRIIISKSFSSNVPKFLCCPGQLTQLWRNIIMNSIYAVRKTRCEGKISISTRMTGDTITVSVKDTGIGIPAELDIDSLGKQLPMLEKGKLKGHGFWIIRKVVENHKGTLRVKRLQAKAGTVVSVVLPPQSS